MAIYYAHGSTGSALGANAIVGSLWNISIPGRRIRVLDVTCGIAGDTGSSTIDFLISRASVRGLTPTVSVTPESDDLASLPPSNAILEMAAFGTPPTLATPPMCCPLIQPMTATATQPYFKQAFPRGIWLAAGMGIAVQQLDATEGFVNYQLGFIFED